MAENNRIVDVNGNIVEVTNALIGGRNKQQIRSSDRFVPSDLYLVPEVKGDNGMPIEYGNTIKPIGEPRTYSEKMTNRLKILDDFEDKTKEFVFGLNGEPVDYFTTDSKGRTINTDLSTISLGSFVSTLDDNEDPTILGFDIIIKEPTSPLFNGAIVDFINHESNASNSEIQSRLKIFSDFRDTFFKYFKSDVDSDAKVHYLKKISGLDALHESNTNKDSKSFVNYGEDMITLSLAEDVTQNMGYLSSLYKMLSWSRINGKQVIPSNLLRFEAEIVITEIRNFNRIVKNDIGVLTSLADNISKYSYTLYDCQFFFNMPHGAEIDITSKEAITSFDIKFDYKFSTMKFERYTYDKNSISGDRKMIIDVINNGHVDVNLMGPGDTNNSKVNETGTIEHSQPLKNYTETNNIWSPLNKPISPLDPDDIIANAKVSVKTDLEISLVKLGDAISKASYEDGKRAVVSRYRLINKTIDNIRSKIPYGGRITEPTNVYGGDYPSFKVDAINGVRDFVGDSIKSLFDKK